MNQKFSLFNQEHLSALAKVVGLQPVKVEAAGQVRTVQIDGVFAAASLIMDQRFNRAHMFSASPPIPSGAMS